MSMRLIVLAGLLFVAALSPSRANATAALHFDSEQQASSTAARHGCLAEHENRGISPQGRTLVWDYQGRGICLTEGSGCRRGTALSETGSKVLN